jgi:hypothetical protein
MGVCVLDTEHLLIITESFEFWHVQSGCKWSLMDRVHQCVSKAKKIEAS